MDSLRVAQVMSPTPTCLDAHCTIAGALELMAQTGFAVMPLVEAPPACEGGRRVRGVVTRRGLLGHLRAHLARPGAEGSLGALLDAPAASLVEPATQVGPDAPMRDAAARLVQGHSDALLVVGRRDPEDLESPDCDELLGILTLRDVARAAAFAPRAPEPGPAPRATGRRAPATGRFDAATRVAPAPSGALERS